MKDSPRSRTVWRTKTVAVLSFGDNDLVVVAIAHLAMTSGITGMPREEVRVSRRYAGCPNGVIGPARLLR
jgi:hypothetical protein